MTRVLLFDMGNVLVRFDSRIALAKLAPRTAYSPDQMIQLMKDWGAIWDYECGWLETQQFFTAICSHLNLCDLTLPEFMSIWSSIFFDDMLISPDTLRSLRRQHRLMLLSNTNAMHFDFIRHKFPVVSEFDETLLSYQLGLMKPDPRIFAEAVARARCEPSEIFFIDDIEENVQAALSVGIPGTRFESEEQLLRELKERGIKA